MNFQAAAAEAAGNHRHFESFIWADRPDDDDMWTIVHTSGRDSSICSKANEKSIMEAMEPFLGTDVIAVRFAHWLCGYVDGFEMRVYDAEGAITKAFKVWTELAEAIEGYPILDEMLYSEMQEDAVEEAWTAYGADDFRQVLSRFQPSIAKMLARSSDEVLAELWREVANESSSTDRFIEESGGGIYFNFKDGCLRTRIRGKGIREELTRLRRAEKAKQAS